MTESWSCGPDVQQVHKKEPCLLAGMWCIMRAQARVGGERSAWSQFSRQVHLERNECDSLTCETRSVSKRSLELAISDTSSFWPTIIVQFFLWHALCTMLKVSVASGTLLYVIDFASQKVLGEVNFYIVNCESKATPVRKTINSNPWVNIDIEIVPRSRATTLQGHIMELLYSWRRPPHYWQRREVSKNNCFSSKSLGTQEQQYLLSLARCQ